MVIRIAKIIILAHVRVEFSEDSAGIECRMIGGKGPKPSYINAIFKSNHIGEN